MATAFGKGGDGLQHQMPVHRWQFRVWTGQLALCRMRNDEEGRELAAEGLQECLCEKSEGTNGLAKPMSAPLTAPTAGAERGAVGCER